MEFEEANDPEILTRISQYELAFRMQTSVPETMNINDEPEYIHQMYGTNPGQASFANNCLLARRLVEKGVRFVQLFDNRWDTHGVGAGNGVGEGMRRSCKNIDQPIAALLRDLKQRGLLDDTLVVWGGEFGRTPMMESRTGEGFDGRDHHLEAFTMWMAGAGVKKGHIHGATDEIGYYGIEGRTHVHDLQATILERLGFDHEKLTYEFQGRNFRLTDVHGKVINEVLT
ncbi:Sulfatases-like protein [Cyclobacterium qasimii M12-11B]|nr:Sulfatases-like protein [Cyclobacterium qasimii M12-11B]